MTDYHELEIIGDRIIKNVLKQPDKGHLTELKEYYYAIIYYNKIDSCENGIFCEILVNPLISYNDIDSKYSISVKGCYNDVLSINYNNLDGSIYAIRTLPYGTAPPLPSDINAENNYFYTINTQLIDEMIYDKNDVSIPQQPYIGTVYYQPFLTEEYPYAGIQGD